MKINFQRALQKLSKYEYKVGSNQNNQVYNIKLKNYRKQFMQLGGVLIHQQLNPNNQHDLVVAIEDVFRNVSHQELLENTLGGGQYGTVYLLLDNVIVKITSKTDSQSLEKFRSENSVERNNNSMVNDIAQNNLCFPKYYYQDIRQFTIGADTRERGIFVSERLYPLFEFFDQTNNFKADFGQNNINAFYKQMYFLLYSLVDYFDKTGNVFVHNDFKLDNILLRKMETPNDNYSYILSNGNTLNIPLINYNGNKWLLVLNDFGESYSYNNLTTLENVKEDIKIIVGFKFLDNEGLDINPNLMKNLLRHNYKKYFAIEFSSLSMMGQEIDRNIITGFLISNIYTRLNQNIMNMNN